MAWNRLDVEVYPLNPSGSDLDGEPLDPMEFKDVQYISLVNFETFGIPAILTEEKTKREMSEHGAVKVLYVNPQNITAMEVTRYE